MNVASTIIEGFPDTPSSRAPALFSGGEKLIVAASAPCISRVEVRGTRGDADEGVNLSPATVIGVELAADVAARDALLDRSMGPRWRKKSSEKLRRGRMPAEGLAFVARAADGGVAGTVRLWSVGFDALISSLEGEMPGRAEGGIDKSPAPPSCRSATSSPSRGEVKQGLLLGPLAVDPALKSAGLGSALMRHAIDEAKRLGHSAILLVGDAGYYQRFGFSAEKTGALAMPGPYEQHRFLALELQEGALDGAVGVLRATGRKAIAQRKVA